VLTHREAPTIESGRLRPARWHLLSKRGDTRRMAVANRYWTGFEHVLNTGHRVDFETVPHVPAFFELECVQCHERIYVLVYTGPRGEPATVAMPSTHGGLATPNTPGGVAYYLDQAQRAHSVGALSAAVAMYRAALEHLLFQQGYTTGMLAAKIGAIEKDKQAPAWFRDLDPAYLSVVKDLGNAAIHPNDANVERQQLLDARLLQQVRQLFVELLDAAYERPERAAQRLRNMQAAFEAFDANPRE
jgi:hypothetical protein